MLYWVVVYPIDGTLFFIDSKTVGRFGWINPSAPLDKLDWTTFSEGEGKVVQDGINPAAEY